MIPRFMIGRASIGSPFDRDDYADFDGKVLVIRWLGIIVEITIGRRK